MNIAAPQIMSFHSTSFCCNVMRKKDSIPGPGHYLCGIRTISPCLHGFPGDSGFLPYPKDVHVRWIGVSTCPSLSECGLVWVHPVMEEFHVQGGSSPWALNCWESFQPPATLNWNMLVGKNYHTCFHYFFLNVYLYNMHLFQCLILEVFVCLFKSLVIFFWS